MSTDVHFTFSKRTDLILTFKNPHLEICILIFMQGHKTELHFLGESM